MTTFVSARTANALSILPSAVPRSSLSSTVWPRPTTRFSISNSARTDRKSTRLNSSHDQISYAVFCLKKKNKKYIDLHQGYMRALREVNESVKVDCAEPSEVVWRGMIYERGECVADCLYCSGETTENV